MTLSSKVSLNSYPSQLSTQTKKKNL